MNFPFENRLSSNVFSLQRDLWFSDLESQRKWVELKTSLQAMKTTISSILSTR